MVITGVVTIIHVIVMLETKVTTVANFRALGSVHTLKRKFRMPNFKQSTRKL